MIRRFSPHMAAALALFAGVAHGQDQTAGGLPGRVSFVRFEIVNGRLAAVCPGQPQPRSASAAHESGLPSETLVVTPVGDKSQVRYQWIDRRQELAVEFLAGTDVRLVREPRGEAGLPRLTFEQPAGRDVQLSLEIRGKTRHYTAPTLWHLILAEPAVCREHLIPALERLRADWLLAERAKQLEASLVELCRSGVIEQRQRCGVLVDQLSSASHAVRQEADRELRGMGQIVMPYLKKLDTTRLDAEQRHRLRRIAADLAVCTGDTPERAAVWMLDDQAVWLSLLAHDLPEYRHEAALQLSRLCDRPIEFDPAAAEIERQAQIEKLRERFAKGL